MLYIVRGDQSAPRKTNNYKTMKLHLPKLLSIAVMSALALPTMGADGPEKWDPSSGVQHSTLLDETKVQTDNAGNTYLDVFYYEGYDTRKYNWYGDLVIGDSGESTGHVDNVGSFVDNWEWVTPTDSARTPDLHVHGNVTVQGNGKVVLGGKFNDSSYQGIEATGITVNGGSLTATKITAADLVVTGGTVSTGTIGCNQGSVFHGGYKYSYIQNSLTISGGSLSFGYVGDDIEGIDSYRGTMTAFGNSSFSMTQTGGTMNVYGAVNLIAGATITQEDNAGATVLRDTVCMQGSGTTTFTQSADSATLVIGKLGRAQISGTQNIVFNQSGDGLIHLAYGSNFKQESTISLNQTGNGVINIGGGHDTALTGALPTNYALDQTTFESNNTTYNLDQSGAGTVNVNGALTADTVKVSGESKLNLNEDVSVNTLTQSEKAEITVAKDKTLVVNGLTISGGVFANNGTINGVVSLAQSAEGESINITDGELVNSGTINASVNMTDGKLVAEAGSEIAGISATGGDILVGGDFTMTGDMMLAGDAELIFADADYTINLGEYDVVFTGNSSIALTLGDADISEVVLFTGAREDSYSGYEVTLLDAEGNSTGTAVMQYNANGDVTLGIAAVPEPTSSMLGLVGLVAFTLRRRRK
ncbi:MAG: PEP-CTERM sorting domain-containing protein [Akkermansiaceae bacterium]|nr:PEP-CTERM sorting domain-containing protein [Akkermansiaceae bacterium]